MVGFMVSVRIRVRVMIRFRSKVWVWTVCRGSKVPPSVHTGILQV